jgi:hypothetical protein
MADGAQLTAVPAERPLGQRNVQRPLHRLLAGTVGIVRLDDDR